MPGSSSALDTPYTMGRIMAESYPQLPCIEEVRQRAVRKQDQYRSVDTEAGPGLTVLHNSGSPALASNHALQN